MVNINFGRSKSKIVIFTKIIFAIELEFAKSAKIFRCTVGMNTYYMCDSNLAMVCMWISHFIFV